MSAYTATEEMPASSQARATRTAISPRFAIRTFRIKYSLLWGLGEVGGIGDHPEPDPSANGALPVKVKGSVAHHADPGVPTGGGLVGQEKHGKPGGRDLGGASHSPLAGKFTLAGALERSTVQSH